MYYPRYQVRLFCGFGQIVAEIVSNLEGMLFIRSFCILQPRA